MTTPTMALAELSEKGADIDVLRQMVQFMAQRLMELDVEARCGAGYDEKNPSGSTAATATATGSGRPAPGRSRSRSPSCAREATSPSSWSPGVPPRRR